MSIRFLVRTLAMSLGIALLTYLGAFLLPKKYSSSMSLYFPAGQAKASNALASLAGGAAASETDPNAMSSLGGAVSSPLVGGGPASATGILLSRTCLSEVVQKLGLKSAWDCSTELRAVDRLRRAVAVSTDKNGFLQIVCTEDSADQCQKVIAAMRQHLDRRAGELTISLASSNRTLVEKQVAKAEKELDSAREQMLKAVAEGGTVVTEEAARNYVQLKVKYMDIKSAIRSAEEGLTERQRAYDQFLAGGGKNPEVLEAGVGQGQSAAISAMATELEKRREDMAEVSRKFASTSPEYRAAKNRLVDIESAAKQELQRKRQSIKTGTHLQLAEARAQLNALKASAEVYNDFIRSLERDRETMPERSANLSEAKANFEAALGNRARLKQELDRAVLAELRDPSRYKVVDEAIVEPDPVSPRKGILAAMAFVLAAAVQFLLLSVRNAAHRAEGPEEA